MLLTQKTEFESKKFNFSKEMIFIITSWWRHQKIEGMIFVWFRTQSRHNLIWSGLEDDDLVRIQENIRKWIGKNNKNFVPYQTGRKVRSFHHLGYPESKKLWYNDVCFIKICKSHRSSPLLGARHPPRVNEQAGMGISDDEHDPSSSGARIYDCPLNSGQVTSYDS